jgi:hypothetical protein
LIVRRVLGSLAGAVATVAAIMAVEALGHRATGAPADPAQATMPMLLWVLVAWTVGPFVGGLVGVMLSRWRGAAWVAAGLVIFGVVATAFTLPTPWWMIVGGLALPIIVAALVGRRVRLEA